MSERELELLAQELGASGARVIDSREIVVEERLAAMCREPGCPNYGLGAGCPPHVGGPLAFRALLAERPQALVFKLEVPTASLLGEQRTEVFRLLQQIAAALEAAALASGDAAALAFAGGSCRTLFCPHEPGCSVIEGGPCRHHGQAVPSMSGYGVDVAALMAAAGWEMTRVTAGTDPAQVPISPVVGLVLLG